MTIQPIDRELFNEFFIRFAEGEFPNQRFGQAFLNVFYPEVTDPPLFYEEYDLMAYIYITQWYLND